MLSLPTAIGLCSLIAVLYVASLYIWTAILGPVETADKKLGRDAPSVIRRRFAGVTVACLAAVAIVKLVQISGGFSGGSGISPSIGHILGVQWENQALAVAYALALTGLFYLGPLSLLVANSLCFGGGLALLRTVTRPIRRLSDIRMFRTYIVAPITEELVFRGCMCPLLLCGGLAPTTVILTCPLFFGAAHLHHFVDLVWSQHVKVMAAAFISCVQFLYTTVFGWYAAFLFMRTGHLLAPVMAHVFCNVMGLPDIEDIPDHPYRLAIILAFGAGIVGFFRMLGPWSAPSLFWNAEEVKALSSAPSSCALGYCHWLLK